MEQNKRLEKNGQLTTGSDQTVEPMVVLGVVYQVVRTRECDWGLTVDHDQRTIWQHVDVSPAQACRARRRARELITRVLQDESYEQSAADTDPV